jgi:hypothetical protein
MLFLRFKIGSQQTLCYITKNRHTWLLKQAQEHRWIANQEKLKILFQSVFYNH